MKRLFGLCTNRDGLTAVEYACLILLAVLAALTLLTMFGQSGATMPSPPVG
jgi:Flp pilus assembly pilin Flp